VPASLRGRKFLTAEGRKDLANQGSAQTVRQLSVVLFIPRTLPESGDAVPRAPWDFIAWD
jgi:hypothetical protein